MSCAGQEASDDVQGEDTHFWTSEIAILDTLTPGRSTLRQTVQSRKEKYADRFDNGGTDESGNDMALAYVLRSETHNGSSPLKAMIPQRLLSEQDPTFVA
jgi:hypothetical protein